MRTSRRSKAVLYERALEQRILLQRCLQASNGLPRAQTHALLASTQPEVQEGFTRLASAARDTLAQLLDLQHTLLARTAGVTLPAHDAAAAAAAAAARAAKRPRQDAPAAAPGTLAPASSGADALWERISSHHAALAPYRDASLDSWHRRTVLSSGGGGGALRSGGLRALNQSVSSQVAALMRDPGEGACVYVWRRAPEKAMRLRGEIALEDAAYRGRKTSRAAMFGEQEEEQEEESGDDGLEFSSDDDGLANGHGPGSSEGDDGDEGEEGEEDVEGEGEEGEDEGEDELAGALGSGSGSDLGTDDDDAEGGAGSESEEDAAAASRAKKKARAPGKLANGTAAAAPAGGAAAKRKRGEAAGGGGELEALEAELEALQQDDEQQLASLRLKGERDRSKGVAVRHQQAPDPGLQPL
ncbi:hypothetical protein TSOC_012099 [Tetrabaena socialis]|uniref:AATF leucine zipper-containing domain-containing protein n=1 Tax=Tetrabaena socialis TaxID=47790 RepID=A0A2J7ZNV9_9CHLO|nr:hypothetical protein TSOC_012099 [Tetrabaena socialis]|eukprot:PNH01955.1 hypothetical protein TSOC_012099 [Tetrabaena socialis]